MWTGPRVENAHAVNVTSSTSLSEFGQRLAGRIGRNVAERSELLRAQGTPLAARVDEIRAIAKKAQAERAELVSVPPVRVVDVTV